MRLPPYCLYSGFIFSSLAKRFTVAWVKTGGEEMGKKCNMENSLSAISGKILQREYTCPICSGISSIKFKLLERSAFSFKWWISLACNHCNHYHEAIRECTIIDGYSYYDEDRIFTMQISYEFKIAKKIHEEKEKNRELHYKAILEENDNIEKQKAILLFEKSYPNLPERFVVYDFCNFINVIEGYITRNVRIDEKPNMRTSFMYQFVNLYKEENIIHVNIDIYIDIHYKSVQKNRIDIPPNHFSINDIAQVNGSKFTVDGFTLMKHVNRIAKEMSTRADSSVFKLVNWINK